MGASESAKLGHHAFNSLSHYLYLDKPERQRAACPLFRALQNLRRGDGTEVDLGFWISRSLLGLSRNATADASAPEWELSNSRLLYATCYNRERDAINQRYVAEGNNVVVVRAVCSGFHANSTNPRAGGQAVRLPRTSFFFVRMIVSLSVNLVPELGLANNSRGRIVEILYPPGGYDPSNSSVFPVIVVDFLGYTGPPWDPQHPTWVPITSVERRCDRGCCSRMGFPLWPAKAGSVHSFQGLTIGDGKQYDRLVFLWDKGAEGRWPGAFYVGASRAMAPHNLALRYTMAKDDLDAIVNGVAWKVQRIKVAQLLDKAREFRTELAMRREQPWHMDGIGAHHWGSKYDFAKRLLGFITTHRLAISQSQFLAQPARDEALRCLNQWEESIFQLRLIP